jgi:antitoxin FitA
MRMLSRRMQMPISITVRNVPEKARDVLAARAAAGGRSLQEYLRAQLVELASRPDRAAVLERIRARTQRTGTHLTAAQILAYRDAGRR